MDRRTGKVLVSRRTKQAYRESKGARDHITVNACISAITTTQFLHLPIPLVHMLVKSRRSTLFNI